MKDDVLSMQIEQARNGDEQAIAGLIARQIRNPKRKIQPMKNPG